MAGPAERRGLIGIKERTTLNWNDGIIEEFRANRGHVTTMGFGDRLVLVHSIGAKTGRTHVFPVAAIPDDGGWLIAASKAGAPDNPAWYHNLLAHPDVDVEVPDPNAADGIRTLAVHATELTGAQRDAAWERFTGASPAFADYATKAAPRVIPVLRLLPRGH